MTNYPKNKKRMTLLSILMLLFLSTSIVKLAAFQQEQIDFTKALFAKRNVLIAKFQQNLVQILLRNAAARVQDSDSKQIQTGNGRPAIRLTRQATVQ
jgi:hypothetical protein